MTFTPIFLANLIFSAAFRKQQFPENLFGGNLVGATLGGIVEYTSMALGYNALAAIVGILYGLVLLLLAAARSSASRESTSASRVA